MLSAAHGDASRACMPWCRPRTARPRGGAGHDGDRHWRAGRSCGGRDNDPCTRRADDQPARPVRGARGAPGDLPGRVRGAGDGRLVVELDDPHDALPTGATVVTPAFEGSTVPDGLPVRVVQHTAVGGARAWCTAPAVAVDLVQVIVDAPAHPSTIGGGAVTRRADALPAPPRPGSGDHASGDGAGAGGSADARRPAGRGATGRTVGAHRHPSAVARIGLAAKGRTGGIAGFGAGVVLDLLAGLASPGGVHAFVGLAVGTVAGVARPRVLGPVVGGVTVGGSTVGSAPRSPWRCRASQRRRRWCQST